MQPLTPCADSAFLTAPQVIQKQYRAAFARWPKDQLRPDVQLQELLNQHLAERLAGQRIGSTPVTDEAIRRATSRIPAAPAADDVTQLRQVNALVSLLDDRYKKSVRVFVWWTCGGSTAALTTQSGVLSTLLNPRSNPTYYGDLMTELEEAPKRSLLGRLRKRVGGMFRLS